MTNHEENRRRIYLDHAATSWPKPSAVLEAAIRYQRACGASAGRGTYGSGLIASQQLSNIRRTIASWIGARSADEIAFTSNGTMALNAGLLGILRPGDRVITSITDHNSVLRPLAQLQVERGITWLVVGCDREGYLDLDALEEACKEQTRMIVLSHASNVTGAVQPIEQIGAIARRAGALLFLDAAQSVGHRAIDVAGWGVDLLAFSGHKGCYGLPGSGVLYLRQELAEDFSSPWIGGTGTQSDQLRAGFRWYEAIESGTHNMPALVSLQAGVEWLQQEGSELHRRCVDLTGELLDFLTQQEALHVHGPHRNHDRVPVISITCGDWSPQDLASMLDVEFGIEVRAGLHCAPLIHQQLGTIRTGGTLRISLGATTQADDIDAIQRALHRL